MFHKVLIRNKLESVLCLLVLLFPFAAQAQDSFIFVASTNARQVLLNSYFEVTFTLKNASGTEFAPPSFEDFIVLAGPSTASSMQILNGAVSREMAYSYTLQPKKAGKFTIGSASIRANGKKITSEPLVIEVLKGSAGSTSKDGVGEVFVKLEINKTDAFIGEQLLLDYKLYTSVSIDGYDVREEPDYKGFFAQELRRFDSPSLREVINGKQYTTKVLRRIALFPQQAGSIKIAPARLQLAVVEETDQTGFFFNRNIRPVFYTTNSLTINAKALPPGAPDNFSGAVGLYDFQVSVSRNLASTDEAVAVNMLISGNGDMKRMQPPALVLSDSFEVYPPKIVDEKSVESQGEIKGEKIIEYLVLPKYPGEYVLSPSFVYFNTQENQFVSIGSGPFQVKVRQGSDRHSSGVKNESTTSGTGDIHFIKTRTNLKPSQSPFVESPVFFTMMAFPALAFIGFLFFRKTTQARNAEQAATSSKMASKEAQKRLATAHHLLKLGKSREFYDEISKASLGYVCHKMDIPLSQLTKDNVREKLHSLNLSPALIDDFMSVIQTCEMALFAGKNNAEDMQATYEKAIEVITGME